MSGKGRGRWERRTEVICLQHCSSPVLQLPVRLVPPGLAMTLAAMARTKIDARTNMKMDWGWGWKLRGRENDGDALQSGGVDPANGRDFIRSEGSGTIWCRIPLQRRRFSLVSFSSACWTGRKSEGTHMAISSPALWRYSEAPEHGLYARRNLGDSTSAKRERAQRAVQEV